MSAAENAELMAKIGQLAGQINRHKGRTESKPEPPTRYQPYNKYERPSTYQTSYWNNSTSPFPYSPSTSYRGRGGSIRGANMSGHRNRSLVLSNGNKPAATESKTTSDGVSMESPSSPPAAATGPAWIAKRDRMCMQLINPAVYTQQAEAKAKAMEKTRLEKLKHREDKEKMRLKSFIQHTSQSNVAVPQREIVLNGTRFLLSGNGSKLVKVFEDAKRPTPQKATVAGVEFVRSKNGNLWRSGFVKTKRNTRQMINKPCKFYTLSGKCLRGKSCPYTHDPDRVAICHPYMYGKCPNGLSCDLSHTSTSHNVPACTHFLRGKCTFDPCKFLHVKTNPEAKICRAFVLEGWCDKGADCAERHVWECPEYDETGNCGKEGCRLAHVESAGRRKLAAARQAEKEKEMDEGEDVSSDEEDYDDAMGSDDVDSDTFSDDEILTGLEDERELA